ncbi:MAG: MarR family winged helix-turn-helix transcriptional regulator [Cellulomonas sp.]|nr:MarR family winged helix-turn-helix transcriptional regulator [Cellulomonas sp.]
MQPAASDSPAGRDLADQVDELFRAVYSAFHRRDGTDRGLSGTSRATLQHLALTGPLSVGEASAHLGRAQSVTSEILAQLERNGLVERRHDEHDRRRTVVWLTDAGRDALRREQSVLDLELLTVALHGADDTVRDAVVAGMQALLDTAPRRKDLP